MKKVRAKMQCLFVDKSENLTSNYAHLTAVTEGSEENERFSEATPSATFQIAISKTCDAADFFEQGKEYYIDISLA